MLLRIVRIHAIGIKVHNRNSRSFFFLVDFFYVKKFRALGFFFMGRIEMEWVRHEVRQIVWSVYRSFFLANIRTPRD